MGDAQQAKDNVPGEGAPKEPDYGHWDADLGDHQLAGSIGWVAPKDEPPPSSVGMLFIVSLVLVSIFCIGALRIFRKPQDGRKRDIDLSSPSASCGKRSSSSRRQVS